MNAQVPLPSFLNALPATCSAAPPEPTSSDSPPITTLPVPVMPSRTSVPF
ncbi:hypothetical protein [Lysobacter gummosus]